MPLDPNIILQGRGIQIDNPMDVAYKAQNMRQMIMQNQALQKSSAEQAQMNDVLKKNVVTGPDGKSSVNNQGVLSEMYKINPAKAMEMEKQFQGHDLAKLKTDTEAMQILVGQATPENWAGIKQKAVQMGITNSDKLPDQATPEIIKGVQMRTLDMGKQIDVAFKQQEMGYKEREVSAKEAEVGKKDKAAVASVAEGLRKERSGLPTTKATQDVAVAFNKIQKAMKVPSAAGDMSMIFSYMKMLDPGSTVREGEYATAQNATGIPSRVINAYNNAMKGEKLNPDQRNDFFNQSKGIYRSQMDVQNQVDSQFSELAAKNGIDPKEVILNFTANEPTAAPKIGTVEDGHVFLGGDPAKKESWKKK